MLNGHTKAQFRGFFGAQGTQIPCLPALLRAFFEMFLHERPKPGGRWWEAPATDVSQQLKHRGGLLADDHRVGSPKQSPSLNHLSHSWISFCL